MTAYTEERVVFKSDDGRTFLSEHACLEHEKKKSFECKRIKFLTQEINKLFEIHGLVFEIYSLDNNGNNNCRIYLKDDEGELEECDENIWIDSDVFEELHDEINYKYGFYINEPLNYWSK